MMILSFHSDIVILETDTLHEQHPNAGAEIHSDVGVIHRGVGVKHVE